MICKLNFIIKSCKQCMAINNSYFLCPFWEWNMIKLSFLYNIIRLVLQTPGQIKQWGLKLMFSLGHVQFYIKAEHLAWPKSAAEVNKNSKTGVSYISFFLCTSMVLCQLKYLLCVIYTGEKKKLCMRIVCYN